MYEAQSTIGTHSASQNIETHNIKVVFAIIDVLIANDKVISYKCFNQQKNIQHGNCKAYWYTNATR